MAAALAAKAKETIRRSLLESLLANSHRDCIPSFNSKEIKLSRLLGTGEFSQVYEIKSFCLDSVPPQASTAKDVEVRQYMSSRERYRNTKICTYALKHLRPTLTQKYKPNQYAQFASDLAQEAELLSVLQHPNIIKLRGVSSTGFEQGPKGYFLIIDRLNETLSQRIAKWKKSTKKLSLDFLQSIKRGGVGAADSLLSNKLEVLLQLAAALMYLHENNIIYRDTKPQNVGFDVRGDLKLFDFGLAKLLPSNDNYQDTYKLSMAGTPRFMAPEVLCEKSKGYNLKADVYSFSVVMWEVLSLEKPVDRWSTPRDQSLLAYLSNRYI
ncbi:hypothetical protein ACHAWO_003993 [Cyclotella atomus]|uniref:Protein kinase domain-containing protein n=1 Tax=Cyclotella atomus TaxID=382360 RepID=A0ABD3NF19_9STRA